MANGRRGERASGRLRSPGFEDEDDDEDENEAPHEWHPILAEGSNQPDPR
jgi:hypothetical protein